MRTMKTMTCFLAVGLFLLSSSNLEAIMRADSKPNVGKAGQGVTVEGNKIKRVNEFLDRVQNGVLYTEKNQYSLSGVNLIDQRETKVSKQVRDSRKRVVEMTFVDGVLKQVIIHK